VCERESDFVWVLCACVCVCVCVCMCICACAGGEALGMFEARVLQGYGARWSADGVFFRGFLEPQVFLFYTQTRCVCMYNWPRICYLFFSFVRARACSLPTVRFRMGMLLGGNIELLLSWALTLCFKSWKEYQTTHTHMASACVP
jgi:hypothetical protein